MPRDTEQYLPPVGFASEPAVERRRWIGRIFLALLVGLLGFVLVNRVFNPQDESPTIPESETTLPAPR